MGIAYEQGARLEDALAALNWARSEGPDEETAPAILLALGRMYSDTRKSAPAETSLRGVLDRYPKSPQVPEALYGLAWCFLDREKPDAALPLFARIAGEFPGHPLAADASFRLGEAEFEAGSFSTAAERYRRAAAAGGPLAARAGYKLGWSLRRLGDHPGAAAAFMDVVTRHATSALALESRLRAGEAYAAAGQDFPALEQLEAVQARAPEGREEEMLRMQAQIALAGIYLRDGDHAGAGALVEGIALPVNGWLGGRAQLLRAEAARGREGARAAAAEFTRAASLWGRYRDIAAEAQFRLGECYEQLGNLPGARAAWQRVVDLYRGSAWDRRSREKLTGKPTVLNLRM
jgi:TolA-binding protein